MAISTQTQNLNLIPGKSAPVVVHLSQGNVGNTVQFYLYDGDNPYYPTNVSIAVHGVRADNTVFGPYAVSATSGSNLVSFTIVSAMASVNGAAIGELVLTDSNQNQIGSANFGMLVEETPYSSSVTYEDDLSIYQRILAYVQSRSADLQNEITARQNAVEAEAQARQSSDASLQAQINQYVTPSTEQPTEVINARVGNDGVTFTNLREAITVPDSFAEYTINFADPTTVEDGKYWLDSDNGKGSASGWKIIEVPVVAGKTYSIYGAHDGFSWFVDANRHNLSKMVSSDGTHYINGQNVTIPSGCAYLHMSKNDNYQPYSFAVINKSDFYNSHILQDYSYGVLEAETDKLKISSIDSWSVEVTNEKIADISNINFVDQTPVDGSWSLVNGVYTFTAPTRGNSWANYPLDRSDFSTGVVNLVINVKSVSGEWRVFLIYKNSSDENVIIGNDEIISSPGTYSYTYDMNYYEVYKGFTGGAFNLVVANRLNSTSSTKYTIVINGYDAFDKVITRDDLPMSLNKYLETMGSSSGDSEKDEGATSVTLQDTNGNGKILQIDNAGTLRLIPKIPSNILYIGNSLLLGFGNHGMASTTVDDDYYAKVNSYLSSYVSNLTTDRLLGTAFEGAEDDASVTSWFTDSLAPKLSNSVELVIVQLGDNVNTSAKNAEFEKSAGMLCEYLRKNCPSARIAWVAMWYSTSAKISVVSQACKKYGCEFINIQDLNVSENQSYVGATYIDEQGNEQTITSAGVASHPGNKGFSEIANRIINSLFV